jgi:hypothetical protein
MDPLLQMKKTSSVDQGRKKTLYFLLTSRGLSLTRCRYE